MAVKFSFKYDVAKNRVYSIVDGFAQVEDALKYKAELEKTLKDVKPGFTFLNDISKFSPAGEEAQKVIVEAMNVLASYKPRKIARVLGARALAGYQMDKASKKEAGYGAGMFASVEEAEEYLDS